LATKWNKSWAGQFHGNKSELETLNINPSVAFKVNEMLSLGLGVSYQKLKATLTSAVTPAIPGSIGEVDGDDWQWGWNAGVLVDFQQGTRLGITYRAETDYTLEGDFSINTPALAAGQSNVKADVKLPATASIGLSHQLDPQIRLLADYTWTGWDSIQELDVVRTSGPLSGRSVTTTQLGFKNSYRVGLGVEYQLNQPWLLRLGVAYDTTPVQDADRTPRLPDEDRTWLSIGARYAPEPNWSVDVGYAYLWVKDASSSLAPTGAEAFKGTLNGTYKGHVQIFGLQGNFRF
jgi:long-chain fatty acid transport protein